jgi:hypothetical protein
VVDLAIAANFVRELTEEQFAEQRRTRRPNGAANRPAQESAPAAREPGRGRTTGMRRTLARLAQARG